MHSTGRWTPGSHITFRQVWSGRGRRGGQPGDLEEIGPSRRCLPGGTKFETRTGPAEARPREFLVAGRHLQEEWNMDYQPTESGDYFAAVAESYDRLQPILSPPYSKGLEMMVDLIPFDPNDTFKFVELGCGTAEPTARVLERFPNATGTCMDSEPEMRSLARKKLELHSRRVVVREADMTNCEIPGCDLAISAKAIHHVNPDDLPALFARIAGALSPGGCFILFDAMSMGTRSGREGPLAVVPLPSAPLPTGSRLRGSYPAEIDARMDFKRKMKAAGKDVEYGHAPRI